MEPIKTELENGERKRDARGRNIATAQRRSRVPAAYDANALTQRAEGGCRMAIRFEEVALSPESTGAHDGSEVTLPGGLLVRERAWPRWHNWCGC